MGVRGLQTFIKENRNSLCRSLILSEIDDTNEAASAGGKGKTPVVVDAWGIVYKLYLDSLPWTSGGEYLRFYKLVKRLVKAWRKVGLEPTFVFDGATPSEKHATVLRRFSDQLLTCQLFYTTSKTSRSSSSFSRTANTVILPPQASHAFLFALRRLDVAFHIVPEGEADGVCVSFANQLGGYVIGQDSDFVIMVGRTERVKGYVPLDMMMWIEGEGDNATSSRRPSPGPDGSFQPVMNRRGVSSPIRQSALLPQPAYTRPTLVLTVVQPQALRQRLRLPPHYMPLFASLCGNDYTPPSTASQFFEPNLDTVQRVEKAARILREQLFSPSANAKASINPGDQVVELVERVVKKLSVYPFDTEQSLQNMVDIIIDAALQYSLPPGGECCSTFPFCGELNGSGCRTTSSTRLDGETEKQVWISAARQAYAAAQRQGYLNSITNGWLYPDRTYLWGVLEDPTAASLRSSAGARRVRTATWGIADEGLGGLRWPTLEVEADKEPDTVSNGVEDEMDTDKEDRALRSLLGVDVTENNSEAGDGVISEDTTLVDAEVNTSRSSTARTSTTRAITEYARQGSSSKLIACQLELPPARIRSEGGLPTCLQPPENRLRVYLEPLSSATPLVRALPVSLQPLVAILRFSILEAASKSSKNDTHKWRRDEVSAVLRATIGTFTMWRKDLITELDQHTKAVGPEEGGMLYPLLESRNAQLIAQLSSTMVDSQLLAQSLLLLPGIPNSDSLSSVEQFGPTHLIPFVFFSGVTLHRLLSKLEPGAGWSWTSEEQEAFEQCWEALIEDLEEGTIVGLNSPQAHQNKEETPLAGEGEEEGKEDVVSSSRDNKKKAKKAKRKSADKEGGQKKKDTTKAVGGGRFDLLGDMTI
ncbi:hypothetical protein CI109_106093 [Kwoniella shandongensis]|uniref:Uncharacterized protein n=1 Tax=Kwoniella shandongensis TaxID=1734106 RepID=A0A5M6BQW7_9TREE|nr:uncharacterized protein CI109_006369 [Kwoniella shandongensis]KAA5525298.1 hypothetical protein CI109_006369 [Kwoniella shandongensis]